MPFYSSFPPYFDSEREAEKERQGEEKGGGSDQIPAGRQLSDTVPQLEEGPNGDWVLTNILD